MLNLVQTFPQFEQLLILISFLSIKEIFYVLSSTYLYGFLHKLPGNYKLLDIFVHCVLLLQFETAISSYNPLLRNWYVCSLDFRQSGLK